MATLFYRVYHAANAMPTGPKISEGTIAIGGTSTQSADVMDGAGSNQPRAVRIFADADCYVTWGDNPTAVNDGSEGMPVGAENPEFIPVLANQKLAVITRA